MKIKSLSDGEEIDMELNPADRDSDELSDIFEYYFSS